MWGLREIMEIKLWKHQYKGWHPSTPGPPLASDKVVFVIQSQASWKNCLTWCLLPHFSILHHIAPSRLLPPGLQNYSGKRCQWTWELQRPSVSPHCLDPLMERIFFLLMGHQILSVLSLLWVMLFSLPFFLLLSHSKSTGRHHHLSRHQLPPIC